MIKLVGDSDGEVRVVSSFWEGDVYLPLEKANTYVSENALYPIDHKTAVATEGIGGFKKYIKEETLKRDDYKCVFCNKEASHIFKPINVYLGGKRMSIANSVACCYICSTEQNNNQVRNSLELRDETTLLKIKEQIKKERELWKIYCIQFNKRRKKNKTIESLDIPPCYKDIDVSDISLHIKKADVEGTKLPERTGVLYTDASLKDGESTLAIVIYENNRIIYKSFQIVETGDNNLAEAEAILAGIKIADTMNIRIEKIYTDSRNVANAVNKKSSISKNKTIGEIVIQIRKLISRNAASIKWIPRKQNKEADKVSRKILEAI